MQTLPEAPPHPLPLPDTVSYVSAPFLDDNREETLGRVEHLLSELQPGSYLLHDGRTICLTERAGRGGCGEAWIAHVEKKSEPVVAKIARVFPGEERRTQTAEERLRCEADILKEVHGDGIPRLLDTALLHDRPLLLLQHIRGKTWKKLFRSQPFCLDARLFLPHAATLAQLLHGLHSRNIVHGDVKPENVLHGASQDNGVLRTWLIDFGLAMRTGDARNADLTGMTLGTCGYMDPRIIDRADARDTASDMYGFGAMLFEAYAGESFHAREEWMALLKALHARDEESLRIFCDEYVQNRADVFSFLTHRLPSLEVLIAELLRYECEGHRRPSARQVAERLLRMA